MILENCISLNDELKFFQELTLDILKRRVVLKKFEKEMKKTNLAQDNDFMSLVWYGYIVSQISDCRKFFDRDDNAHSFKFVVRHIKNKTLGAEHTKLFKVWTNGKLETIRNKYLIHAEKSVSEIKIEISTKTLDLFINSLENYLKKIVEDLTKNYKNIDSLNYDSYLMESENEVDIFFAQVRK